MLRRGRNGRARHVAWNEIRQEADDMDVIQTLDSEEWEGQTTTQVRHRRVCRPGQEMETVHT